MFLNQVSLIGNLGQDPAVLKETDKGCFVRLNLATNRIATTTDGEKVQTTQWHTVYVSNGTGKYIASQAKKGMALFVLGELRYSKYTSKSGQEIYEAAVYASKCDIFQRNKSESVEPVETTGNGRQTDSEKDLLIC